MEISSYGVKIMPSSLFEEEKKMVGVDFGEDTASMVSSKTTESVASIFLANADFLSHVESKSRGGFDPTKGALEGASSILLLDLRDSEEYALSHIKGAINYPGVNIARDKFTPQMHEYKNVDGKIIVLYSNDE
jgi:hypothetical protein